MAIKKPITKLKSKPAAPVPAPSKLKKRPREVEPDEEESDEEEDEEPQETIKERRARLAAEAAAPKKKKKPAPVEEDEDEVDEDNEADVSEDEPDEDADVDEGEPDEDDVPEPDEEEDEAPAPRKGSKKKKGKKKRSLADIFDSTKPGRGLMPAGDFKMKVNGYELEGEIAAEGEEQGLLKVKVTYEGHEDEEEGVAGKTISQWYQIADEDGEPGPGIPFLKGDLDILGYEDVLLADLEDIFEDVATEEPLVIVRVKQNAQYTNAYLQGLAEEE